MRQVRSRVAPPDYLDIGVEDAERLGVADGGWVRIVSRYGAAVLPARLTHMLPSGQLFATFHTSRVFLNTVTSSHRDGTTGTPEYKVTAVRIETPQVAGESATL